jgi:O-antigen/teichoic acid export membrane protein
MDLQKKTYSALFWSLIDRGGEQLIRFVFSIVLARLLLPEHFGLIGMAYVVTEIARVFVQSGFGMALINKTDANKTDECSVFYFNLILGAGLTALIYFLSPVIGRFYKSTALIPILRLLSFNVILGSFGLIQSVVMTKNIDFKAQTKVGLPATLISGTIGIIMAYASFGIWSLVAQIILRTLLNTIFLWMVSSWRPIFVFSINSLKNMFGYGSKLLLTSLVQMIFLNFYTILIGKLYSPVQLGYYTRASQCQQLPMDTFWVIIGRVTFPILSTLKNSPEKLKSALAKASGNMSLLIFPFLVIISLSAHELFFLLFGAKWEPSIRMFQILCFANILMPLEQLKSNLIVANGNAALHFKLQLFKYCSTTGAVALTYRFGIHCMLITSGIVSYINFIVNSYFVKREIEYKLTEQLMDILPYGICTSIAGLGMFLISILNEKNLYISLVLKSFTGIIIYLLSCYIFKVKAFMENINILATAWRKIINKPVENGVTIIE